MLMYNFILGNYLFFIFELLGFFAFAAILTREMMHKNKVRIIELFSCLVFGMILEIGNTYLAHTYSYSPNFFFQIFNVPMVIGFGWAVIVYSAMLLSDQYNIPWKIRPIMDALTALILDLSMDIVAIRLGFWNWSIPLDQEWYGVPFENLIGWVFVVFTFSFTMRIIRTLNWERIGTKILILLNPIICYGLLLLELTIFSLVVILPYQINNWTALLKFNYVPDIMLLYNPQVQMWKVIILVMILTLMLDIVIRTISKQSRTYLYHFDLLSFLILSLFHLFFFVGIFVAGIYKTLPIIIFIAIDVFLLHCLMHFLPYIINPKTIYLFKKTRKIVKKRGEKIGDILEDSFK